MVSFIFCSFFLYENTGQVLSDFRWTAQVKFRDSDAFFCTKLPFSVVSGVHMLMESSSPPAPAPFPYLRFGFLMVRLGRHRRSVCSSGRVPDAVLSSTTVSNLCTRSLHNSRTLIWSVARPSTALCHRLHVVAAPGPLIRILGNTSS
jgi:hypothetical protein